MHTTTRITLSPQRKQPCGRTQKSSPRTAPAFQLYKALALLTDSAQRLLAEIKDPIALQANLEFLDHAIKNAEKILLKHPLTQ